MAVSWTYCGNHFTVYLNQTILLYTLSFHSDVCQLFLKKKLEKFHYSQRYPQKRKTNSTGLCFCLLCGLSVTWGSTQSWVSVQKGAMFWGTPDDHFDADSLRDSLTVVWVKDFLEGRREEISEIHNTCYQLRIEMNEHYVQLWMIF